MAEETLREFFDRRERELKNRLEALQGQLKAITAELAEIERAREAAGPGTVALSARATLRTSGTTRLSPMTTMFIDEPVGPPPLPFRSAFSLTGMSAYYASLTIKGLVMQAFKDNEKFRQRGVTAGEIREFIRDAYGRDIDRASLSPQISRLFQDNLLFSVEGTWHLNEALENEKSLLEKDEPALPDVERRD